MTGIQIVQQRCNADLGLKNSCSIYILSDLAYTLTVKN